MMKDTKSYQAYKESPYKCIKYSTYFDCYDHFFESYRGKEITFIEIGVLGGGSLFMWREYFGPKARIIGVDLNPNAKKWEKHGFEIYIGNQSDENFWKEFKSIVGGIDIVLDDGGHTYEQQIITIECLLGALNDGGLILVEDTHTSYMRGFGPKKYSFMEYVKNKIDAVNYRFGEFSEKKDEKRFWSIEIVESMVAFKINNKATMLVSELMNNGGEDDLAKDYRYDDNPAIDRLLKFSSFFRFLKYFPFARPMFNLLIGLIANRGFSAKKYFD